MIRWFYFLLYMMFALLTVTYIFDGQTVMSMLCLIVALLVSDKWTGAVR